MEITALKPTKQGRMALFVDGQFLFSLAPELCATEGLKVGRQVEIGQLEALRAQSDLKKAKEKALQLLSRQAYTAGQLRQKLAQHTDGDTAAQAVERMEQLGLVDDAAYARQFAQELAQRKRFGPLRIRRELCRRGIDPQLAQQALEELELDPEGAMGEILARKYAAAPQDPAVRRRAYGALLRMGYQPAQARRALDDFCGGGWAD